MEQSNSQRITPTRRAALPAAMWTATVPIRFGHCDAAGIVFTPRYLEMLIESVERFFADALKLDYYAFVSERRIGLGYAHASCEFLQPNRMGEVLDVGVIVERIGQSSYTMVLPVLKNGEEVVRGRLVTVTTRLADFGVCPIPDDLRTALTRYRDRCAPP